MITHYRIVKSQYSGQYNLQTPDFYKSVQKDFDMHSSNLEWRYVHADTSQGRLDANPIEFPSIKAAQHYAEFRGYVVVLGPTKCKHGLV